MALQIQKNKPLDQNTRLQQKKAVTAALIVLNALFLVNEVPVSLHHPPHGDDLLHRKGFKQLLVRT